MEGRKGGRTGGREGGRKRGRQAKEGGSKKKRGKVRGKEEKRREKRKKELYQIINRVITNPRYEAEVARTAQYSLSLLIPNYLVVCTLERIDSLAFENDAV